MTPGRGIPASCVAPPSNSNMSSILDRRALPIRTPRSGIHATNYSSGHQLLLDFRFPKATARPVRWCYAQSRRRQTLLEGASGITMDIGAQLRTAREANSLSIATLAERTRVPARTLAAIERNDQSALPPHPFARGFVRSYAEELDLDPDQVARDFFAQFPEQPDSSRAPVLRELPDVSWQPPSQWMGMATAVAILLVVVAAAVVLGRRSDSTPPPGSVGTTGTSAATPVPTAAPPVAPKPVDQPDRTAAPAIAAPPRAGCDYRGPVPHRPVLGGRDSRRAADDLPDSAARRAPHTRGRARDDDPFRQRRRRRVDDQWERPRDTGRERRGPGRQGRRGDNAATVK